MNTAKLKSTNLLKVTLVVAAALVAAWVAALVGTEPSLAAAMDAPKYTVTDLGAIPDNTDSGAFAINNSAQVVGELYNRFPAPTMAFLYENGTMTELGVVPGGENSSANGINETAQIVGRSYVTDLGSHRAFLYENGTMTNLGTLPNPGPFGSSEAYDINDSGQVVGYSNTMEGSTDGLARARGFVYEGGSMIDLGTLGITNGGSRARAINNSGQIVGEVESPSNTAFLYENGTMTDLGKRIGALSSIAMDINDSGQIVGGMRSSSDQREAHAFLYDTDGSATDLGTLPGRNHSVAKAINSSGQVVGLSSLDQSESFAPFLYSGGAMTNLNDLILADSGWVLIDATDINDSGMIVGWGINPNGDQRAFLLTPPYTFSGFYQPVDNLPTLNKTKPGKTIPVRFSLGGDKGLDIFAKAADGSSYPKSESIACDSTALVDGIEETASVKHGLVYDPVSNRYTYDWGTSSTWSGCRQLVMKFKGGSVQRANFIFK